MEEKNEQSVKMATLIEGLMIKKSKSGFQQQKRYCIVKKGRFRLLLIDSSRQAPTHSNLINRWTLLWLYRTTSERIPSKEQGNQAI